MELRGKKVLPYLLHLITASPQQSILGSRLGAVHGVRRESFVPV